MTERGERPREKWEGERHRLSEKEANFAAANRTTPCPTNRGGADGNSLKMKTMNDENIQREEERLFAGKLFDARRPELKAIKHRAHECCRKFNALDEWDESRQELIGSILGSAGRDFYFQGPVQFNYGTHTHIGDYFFANFNLLVMDDGPIHIGNHVMIGPNVSLLASNHPLLADERLRLTYPDGHRSMSEFSRGIRIEDDVWIAANVSVLDGVTIGRGAVIGAGSVVSRDIPAGWLAFGNPARPVRPITEADSRMDLL